MKYEGIVNVNSFGYVQKKPHEEYKIRIDDFPAWISNERKKQNLTQKELSEKSKVSTRTITRIESEHGTECTIFTCIKLADALGYSISMSGGKIVITKDENK